MNKDQPFKWKSSMCWLISWVGWSLGISKARETVLVRLMEYQILHQLAGSVGGEFRKGTMASACLDDRYFSFSLYTTGVFQAATLVLEL